MAKKLSSFRVGRVRAFLRGQVWYLSYFEQGQRRQPRVGSDQQAARAMAAEINGQLEAGAPSALGFQPISFPALRDRWLDHHEHVRRSSLNTSQLDVILFQRTYACRATCKAASVRRLKHQNSVNKA